METDLVWLRGELRLADNPLLASPGGISERLVVYVIDAALLEPQAPLDIPRMGARRLRFLWQSLRELRGELLKCGSDLLVTVGEPVTLVANLAERIGASAVRVGEHPGSEEQQQVQRLSQLLHPGCRLDTFSTATLWAHATLPIAVEEVPGSWSAFKRKLGEAKPSAKALPAGQPLSPPGPIGRLAGCRRCSVFRRRQRRSMITLTRWALAMRAAQRVDLTALMSISGSSKRSVSIKTPVTGWWGRTSRHACRLGWPRGVSLPPRCWAR